MNDPIPNFHIIVHSENIGAEIVHNDQYNALVFEEYNENGMVKIKAYEDKVDTEATINKYKKLIGMAE
jgi:hypothetical protein